MIRVWYHYWARIRHDSCSKILWGLFCIWSFKLSNCIYDTMLFPSHTIKTNRYLVLLAPPLINASMANFWAKKAVDLEMSLNQKLFYRPWRLKILSIYFSLLGMLLFTCLFTFFFLGVGFFPDSTLYHVQLYFWDQKIEIFKFLQDLNRAKPWAKNEHFKINNINRAEGLR